MFKENYIVNNTNSANKLQKTVSDKKDIVKYSVVIPVYQEEKILPKVLSIYTKEARQKYNFELIISDGGSTDKSVEIAKKYADKIVVHKETRRQTIAEGRNKGAEIADGNILIFVNADTYPVDINSFFEAVTGFAHKDNNEVALACIVRGIPEEERFIDRMFYAIHNPLLQLGNKLNYGFGRGECQVIKKDAFVKAGKYNESFHAGEDFDLYGRLVKLGKIRYDKNIFVYESTRRFRKYGYLRVLSLWTMNALAVKFSGHSHTDDWKPVR